jgi:alpha 1,2-mannosyltransferase
MRNRRNPRCRVASYAPDNVPVCDPTFLFDTPQYTQCGAIFWPGYHRLSPDRAAWRVFGNIPYRDEPQVELGQIVIDKRRCWRALTFANWCGERSAFFFSHFAHFAHVHGDKELFHLCWRKLGQEYAMPSRGIHTLTGTMCHHDFQGTLAALFDLATKENLPTCAIEYLCHRV